MTDRNVQYPYRFHVRPVPGTDDIFEIIPAPGAVYEDGTFWNKQNVLKDATAALYGEELPKNPTPDDVFALIWDRLYRAETGKVKVIVKVVLENGSPVSDVCVSGIKTFSGENVFTGPDGRAEGYTNSGTIAISIANHLDITSDVKEISAQTGKSYSVSLTAKKQNFKEITSTADYYISALAKRIDVSVGGGGGGGGLSATSAWGGGGGGGGQTTTKENVSFHVRTAYTAQVGAGGRGWTYVGGLSAQNGGAGGYSSFLGVGAGGGSGGSGNSPFPGGSGNGTGGQGGTSGSSGTTGTKSVYSSFTETILYGGGGGGGSSGTSSGGNGGSPGGGYGSSNYNASSGYNGGGGGGSGLYSASGSNGRVAARIWFEEDLAA